MTKMKIRLLIILFIFFILFPVSDIFAPPPPDYQGSFEHSKWVIIGNITAVEILSEPDTNRAGFSLYTLDVEEYLKNPIENSTITILGSYHDEDGGKITFSKLYETNQRVLFYIQELRNLPGYDYIIRDRMSGVITEELCPENTSYQTGLCFYNNDQNKAHPPCINQTMDDCKQHRITFEDESENKMCGAGTENIEGTCQVIKTERMKTVGDDAPFFGIFAYLEKLFSWVVSSPQEDIVKTHVATFDFEGDGLGNYERWCVDNGGDWLENYDCGFKTSKEHKEARHSLRALVDVYVEGKPAKDACEFLELRQDYCDVISSFPAKFDMRTGQYTIKHLVDHKDFEIRVHGDGIQYRPNSAEEQDESSWIDYESDN